MEKENFKSDSLELLWPDQLLDTINWPLLVRAYSYNLENDEYLKKITILVGYNVHWNADTLKLRVQFGCFEWWIFHSQSCTCRQELDESLKTISNAWPWIMIYLQDHEWKWIWLTNKIKLRSYEAANAFAPYEAARQLWINLDKQNFLWFIPEILKQCWLDKHKIHLITNNPDKVKELRSYGLAIVDIVPLRVSPLTEEAKREEEEKIVLWKRLAWKNLKDLL